MYNISTSKVIADRINKLSADIEFSKLEKQELVNQLEYLERYTGNDKNFHSDNIENDPRYSEWKTKKLIFLQQEYDNLLYQNQFLSENNKILNQTNLNLKKENLQLNKQNQDLKYNTMKI